jgi:hypothetical protein
LSPSARRLAMRICGSAAVPRRKNNFLALPCGGARETWELFFCLV